MPNTINISKPRSADPQIALLRRAIQRKRSEVTLTLDAKKTYALTGGIYTSWAEVLEILADPEVITLVKSKIMGNRSRKYRVVEQINED